MKIEQAIKELELKIEEENKTIQEFKESLLESTRNTAFWYTNDFRNSAFALKHLKSALKALKKIQFEEPSFNMKKYKAFVLDNLVSKARFIMPNGESPSKIEDIIEIKTMSEVYYEIVKHIEE